MTSRTTRAFTLIELLVVIAIIGILSAVVLASLGAVRARARDRARLADMRALITALEMAKHDGDLPVFTNAQVIQGTASTTSSLANRLTPYLPVIPQQTQALIDINASYSYRYCNRNVVGDGFVCVLDTDPNTYAIRFYTETRPLGGGSGSYYCATSQGIEAAPVAESGNAAICIQR